MILDVPELNLVGRDNTYGIIYVGGWNSNLVILLSGEASTLFMRGPNIYTNKIFSKTNILNLIYKQNIHNIFNNIKFWV
jgi:hypothetical protein